MLNNSIEPTPRSMKTSGIWSKEGKTKGGKATHWSFLSKKERISMPKCWVSKKDEYTKAVYKNFTIYTKIKIC